MQERPDASPSDTPVFKAHVVPPIAPTEQPQPTQPPANQSESNSPSPRLRYKVNAQEFIALTTEDERSSFAAAISSAVRHFANQDRCVYFESLGIVMPRVLSQRRTRQIEGKLFIQVETFRTLTFEKCDDAASLQKEVFGEIVETRELADQFFRSLPDKLRARWQEVNSRALVRGFFQWMRQEIILQGFCGCLPNLGDFFALHNRQGESQGDWFAGADIFLRPRYHQTLVVEPSKMMDRPILHSAWELLEAAYGPPARTLELDLVRELSELGYDSEVLSKELREEDRRVRVAVFLRLQAPQALIYCTDGLRQLGWRSEGAKSGNELVFQLGLASHGEDSVIPDWPTRPLTMGWILMQSARSKSIKPGAGIACDAPLIKNSDGELRSIFTTPFAPVRAEQLGTNGSFSYVNIVGITADEAELAVRRSPNYLLKVLEYKELDQCTKPGRSSVIARTFLDVALMESSQSTQTASDHLSNQEVSIL